MKKAGTLGTFLQGFKKEHRRDTWEIIKYNLTHLGDFLKSFVTPKNLAMAGTALIAGATAYHIVNPTPVYCQEQGNLEEKFRDMKRIMDYGGRPVESYDQIPKIVRELTYNIIKSTKEGGENFGNIICPSGADISYFLEEITKGSIDYWAEVPHRTLDPDGTFKIIDKYGTSINLTTEITRKGSGPYKFTLQVIDSEGNEILNLKNPTKENYNFVNKLYNAYVYCLNDCNLENHKEDIEDVNILLRDYLNNVTENKKDITRQVEYSIDAKELNDKEKNTIGYSGDNYHNVVGEESFCINLGDGKAIRSFYSNEGMTKFHNGPLGKYPVLIQLYYEKRKGLIYPLWVKGMENVLYHSWEIADNLEKLRSIYFKQIKNKFDMTYFNATYSRDIDSDKIVSFADKNITLDFNFQDYGPKTDHKGKERYRILFREAREDEIYLFIEDYDTGNNRIKYFSDISAKIKHPANKYMEEIKEGFNKIRKQYDNSKN